MYCTPKDITIFNTSFSNTSVHKFKRLLLNEHPVSNTFFWDFWYASINNHQICLEKDNKN